MRKELDLFANVRPVRVPEQGIDWTFFRENTEDLYALGSDGINVTDDLAIDFRLITTQGSERIIELAFDFAAKNGIDRLTVVTKANVVKTTDGKFLDVARNIATKYPEIKWDDWYIDIMTAKLVDTKRRTEFKVMVLPNLYGDILTDEAAEFQGGVGTAGSANIGKRYAMFEAIHGSAPRMVDEGRAEYADPSSMIRASAMLLQHIGYPDRARKLEQALDIAGRFEKRLQITGRSERRQGLRVRGLHPRNRQRPERWSSAGTSTSHNWLQPPRARLARTRRALTPELVLGQQVERRRLRRQVRLHQQHLIEHERHARRFVPHLGQRLLQLVEPLFRREAGNADVREEHLAVNVIAP